jgi:hypothetical protein
MGTYDELQTLKKPSHPSHPEVEAKERKTSLTSQGGQSRVTSTNGTNEQLPPNASTLASYTDSTIETIRKTVKAVGKEVSFIRLTQNEKNQLADILYTFKRQGVKTTENEVNRIGLNLLLEDYRANGENSVLARVIAALLA